jgi:glutamate formiminotransferase
MVAWNIELLAPSETAGLDAARAIARAMRASGGGEQSINGLQALGFLLAQRGLAQVSMNLHDAAAAAERGDTLHAIRAVIADLARAHGVEIGESEIVGLVNERVLREGGDPVELRIRGGWERAALERR